MVTTTHSNSFDCIPSRCGERTRGWKADCRLQNSYLFFFQGVLHPPARPGVAAVLGVAKPIYPEPRCKELRIEAM